MLRHHEDFLRALFEAAAGMGDRGKAAQLLSIGEWMDTLRGLCSPVVEAPCPGNSPRHSAVVPTETIVCAHSSKALAPALAEY